MEVVRGSQEGRQANQEVMDTSFSLTFLLFGKFLWNFVVNKIFIYKSNSNKILF